MKLHALCGPPDAELARGLAQFERAFSYPLGEHARFNIAHGEDYTRFFRSMGRCRVLVAERGMAVLGTLAGAVRTLNAANGTSSPVLYVGDLKVVPGSTSGFALARLAEAMAAWARPQVTAPTPSPWMAHA